MSIQSNGSAGWMLKNSSYDLNLLRIAAFVHKYNEWIDISVRVIKSEPKNTKPDYPDFV